jgi:hypothetical protein
MTSDVRDASSKNDSTPTFEKPKRRGSWKDKAIVLDTESGCVDIQRRVDIDASMYMILLLVY